jgi:hypothetical protein
MSAAVKLPLRGLLEEDERAEVTRVRRRGGEEGRRRFGRRRKRSGFCGLACRGRRLEDALDC